jgi:nascent polypeptide-associated complex subunit alpha
MPEMTEVEKPVVPETKPEQSASSTDSDSEEEIPELEDAGAANAGATAFPGAAAAGLPIDMVSKAKQSRGEKKARKIMSKLGLKPVSHVPKFALSSICFVMMRLPRFRISV